MMDTSGVSRWSPLIGALAPVLWFIGVTVSESGGLPEEGAGADEILSYFQDDTTSILLGGILFMLGTLAFVLFISVLRGRWRAADASENTTALAFGTGIVGAAFMASTWAPQLGIAVAMEDMSAPIAASTAEAAFHMGVGFFVIGELFLALFLFATAALILKNPVLPKWSAWIAVALGVIALIPPIGWAAIIFGLPVWLLFTSIMLAIKGPAAPEPVASR